ncbi:MotA/TolQ/ExbB proton channel family protein [Myxococcota bacterium]|nr:MotA/TolQ/ExbB proton channel family protein [Myxococcota bacterium]
MQSSHGLIGTLMELPIFQAEWVLYLLFVLSIVSVAIMIERAIFYSRHSVDSDAVRRELAALLSKGQYDAAATMLAKHDSLETNVVLFGLREYRKGPDAVQDLLSGAETKERQRFTKWLSVLATVGSNSPFIGLFGTVLGIIRAFKDLAGNLSGAGNNIMYGISEALIATAVGLLVAIPAVIAYNVFTNKVKALAANADLLAKTLLAELKSEESPAKGA